MKDFLLSLISPLKMKKYRFMSILIAILIFIVTIYLLSIPHSVYMKSHKEEYLNQKAYVNAYLDLPELANNAEYNKLLNAKYKVNENYQMTSTNSSNEPQIYSFKNVTIKLYNEEEKVVNFHIVFDVHDTVTNELDSIKEEYIKLYPDDSNNKANYASYIYFYDKINSQEEIDANWKNNKLEQLHNTEEKELSNKMDNINNFDLFGIEYKDYDYLLIFLQDTLVTHIPYYDEDKDEITYPALSSSYSVSKMNFDFSNCTTFHDFGRHFADTMFTPLSNTDQTEYLLQVIGYVLIFPAIFVLVLSWAMKKRGVMKTFKEYYNIASIASIVPAIVVFIIGWFIPNVIVLYGALFCIFTLFTFIKINSTPELGD